MVPNCDESVHSVYDKQGIDPSLKTAIGDWFTRNFSDDQTKYGYPADYQPAMTFTYRSPTAGTPTATITLIDDDKLFMRFSGGNTFAINRDFHYQRNRFNVRFPVFTTNLSAYGSGWGGSFFHQFGAFTGDVSQYDNTKIWTGETAQFAGVHIQDTFQRATSEAIYQPVKGGYLRVEAPLNMGSFNFAEGISFEIRRHWIYDVYPYLLWGNAQNDPSSLRERLIWDAASTPISGEADLRSFRGEDLYAHESASISRHLAKEDWTDDQIIETLMKRLEP